MERKEYIASRISRLGTETAFEVLARAKALERQGKSMCAVTELLDCELLGFCESRHNVPDATDADAFRHYSLRDWRT